MDYDISYYQNLLRIHTATAKQICDIRWNFIREMCCVDDTTGIIKLYPHVLDFGCGVGWFAAFKPDWVSRCDTFDVMPVPQTGIKPNYDIVTMWDVLEHIADFTQLEKILLITKYVAMSIPMKPDNVAWLDWKHFKPGEHLHYYTEDLLCALFAKYDFSMQTKDTPEYELRKDVVSFVFKKRGVL